MPDAPPKYALGEHPDMPAPTITTGIVGWMRANLFSSPVNSVFTILFAALLVWLVPKLLNWAFFDAVWTGTGAKDCLTSPDAACWAFVSARWDQFMYGFFPAAERWRPDVVGALMVLALVPIMFERVTPARLLRGAAIVLGPIFVVLLYFAFSGDGVQAWPFRLIVLALAVVALIAAQSAYPRLRRWFTGFLMFVFPVLAFLLLLGLSPEAVQAWPYWLMGLSAIALAVLALLPRHAKLTGRSLPISVALIVLFVIWGLAVPSNWTQGLAYGVGAAQSQATATTAIVAAVLTLLPMAVMVALLLAPRTRSGVLDRFVLSCLLVGVLAFLGNMLMIQAWDAIRGDSPPWAMAIAPAALAVAALAPWGYDRGAGLPGKIALALAPLYLLIAYWVLFAPPDFLNLGILDWQKNTVPFFRGVQGVLPDVETPLWGGLMLTLVVALTGIVASLPLGIVLALGRRSNMPIIRSISVIFIEFWRGVPLITVLFMATVMFPLFLPEGVTFNQLLRALIGVALFSSAYMAEVVRGGLQAIPKGQYEAADALGLSYWKSMRLVILPQALKIVIPGIVNTFIGLFKDTTLVSIIGLFDLLGMVQAGLTDSKWLAPNVPYTGYVFAAFAFWIFCYGMSRYSQYMERKLDTGHKR